MSAGALEGKVAIITGAAGAIGSAGVRVFAAAGARVVGFDLNRPEAEGEFIRCDVGDPEDVAAAVAEVIERHGRLDVLYNNAGGSVRGDAGVVETEDEVFWSTIRTNLFGTWLCCKNAIPPMLAAGGGAIVNTSSTKALIGIPPTDAYTAAKGGVAALTRSLAVVYGSQGIRVNALAPGMVPNARNATYTMSEDIRLRHVAGVVEPEQVAELALFLASDSARRITGQVHVIDGGFTISIAGTVQR